MMSQTTSTPSKAPPTLFDHTPGAARELLTRWVAERGLPAYRAGQISRRLWQALDQIRQAGREFLATGKVPRTNRNADNARHVDEARATDPRGRSGPGSPRVH